MRPAKPGARTYKSSQSVPLTGDPAEADLATAAAGDRRRMLVIDDHDQARRMVVEHFRARGWQVVSAHDFQSALELATEQQPHVIISEVALVDARGHHFVRSLKTVIDHDVRIVAVTNVPVEHVSPREFDMVFAKPADLDAVSDYVEAALK